MINRSLPLAALAISLWSPALSEGHYGEAPIFHEDAEKIIIEGEVLSTDADPNGGYQVLVIFEN